MDGVFCTLWLATQSVNTLHYSLIHLQFLRASEIPSRFAAVTNKDISQVIKQAAPEIHGEGDEVQFESFNR